MEILAGSCAIGGRPSFFDHDRSSGAPWISLIVDPKEATVILTYLLRLLERSGAFLIQASKVSLDILDVEFEVLANEFSKLMRFIRIGGNKRSCGSKAGLSLHAANEDHQHRNYPPKGGSAQPEVSQTPYFLE